MSVPAILFTILAAITACSAIGVVFSKGIIRSAIYLLLALVGVSLLFFLLGAEFLGAAQLIVYVGGTLVLVVFGGMLTSGGPFSHFQTSRKEWLIGSILTIGLFILLTANSIQMGKKATTTNDLPGVAAIGLGFLGVSPPQQSSYLLPFELISIHLLVVLVGAAYLARAKRKTGAT